MLRVMSGMSPLNLAASGLLVAFAWFCGAMLKSARMPGWAVMGGILAGLLLGPGVFGRVLPVQFESLFVGGIEQRQARDQRIRRHGADLVVARKSGAGEEYVMNLRQQYEQALAANEAALAEARWNHQQPLRLFATFIIALTLLGSITQLTAERDRRQGHFAPLSIGVGAALLPGMMAFIATRWLWEEPIETALLVGSALAIGPWALGVIDREAADQAECGGAHMVQMAGRFATIIGLVGLGSSLWMIGGAGGTGGGGRLVWGLPLLALPLSWLFRPVAAPVMRRLVESILIPTLAALAMIKVDPILHFHIWMVLVMMLLGGDGRWFGAFFGAMAPGGRRSMRTMRLILGMMSCGPTMLAIAVIGAHTNAIPENLTLALILGAGLIELTTSARRTVVRRLIETEEEYDEMKNQL